MATAQKTPFGQIAMLVSICVAMAGFLLLRPSGHREPSITAAPAPYPEGKTAGDVYGRVTRGPSGPVTREGFFACVDLTDYSELIRMRDAQDYDGVRFLMDKNRCVWLKPGLRASVLDTSWGKSKIRVYTGDGNAVDLWSNSEAVGSQ
jgi:hypothetical protein